MREALQGKEIEIEDVIVTDTGKWFLILASKFVCNAFECMLTEH